MKKPALLVSLIILIVVVGVFAMQGKSKMSSNPPMKIASTYWPGQYWADIAYEKGWFKEVGLEVELVDANADYRESIQSVIDGSIDTQNFWVYDLMAETAKGSNLSLVVSADSSIGAEAIVARKGITTIGDLKGKKVGVEKELATVYILYTILKQNNIDFNDVSLVYMQSENIPKAFMDGEIDAAITWEPIVTDALKKKGSTKLWDSSKTPGIISAGYVFQKDFIAKRPADVQKFVDVWNRTSNYIKEYPNESYAIIAKKYEDTLENVVSYTKMNSMHDLTDNLKAFSTSGGFRSLPGQIKLINLYLNNQGIITKDIEASQVLDPQFIYNLK